MGVVIRYKHERQMLSGWHMFGKSFLSIKLLLSCLVGQGRLSELMDPILLLLSYFCSILSKTVVFLGEGKMQILPFLPYPFLSVGLHTLPNPSGSKILQREHSWVSGPLVLLTQ